MGALNSADLDRLATLHRESLPDSAVSGFGQAYARAFYHYVRYREKELLILHRDWTIGSTASGSSAWSPRAWSDDWRWRHHCCCMLCSIPCGFW